MQKINRLALKEALEYYEINGMFEEDFDEQNIVKAAAILLEITDPEFVPSDAAQISGCKANQNASGYYKDIFRAMMSEVYDGK